MITHFRYHEGLLCHAQIVTPEEGLAAELSAVEAEVNCHKCLAVQRSVRWFLTRWPEVGAEEFRRTVSFAGEKGN